MSSSSIDAPNIERSPQQEPLPLPEAVGRYGVIKRLGVGGMAEVLLGEKTGPGGFVKKVVVKRLLPHLAIDKKFVELFLREARIAARLAHPNVVQVYELGDDSGRFFIAMEYIDGITIYQLAKRIWGAGKMLPLEVTLRAIADAALGLHHAHELRGDDGNMLGVVHRDISPDNLMMTREGMTKVLDFGIAKPAAENLTGTGELKGKIPFMAPEMLRGDAVDRRADIYALGVTLFWLLTGRRPFRGNSDFMTIDLVLRTEAPKPSSIVANLPPELDAIVLAMLAKDPNHRIATAAEVHRLLSPMLAIDAGLSQAVVETALELPDRPPGVDDAPPLTSAATNRLVAPEQVAQRLEAVVVGPKKKRNVAVAIAALGLVGVIGAVVASARGDEPPPAPAPAVAAAFATQPVVAPVVEAAAPVQQSVDDAGVGTIPAAHTAVMTTAPAHIEWKSRRGALLGTGSATLAVPAGHDHIVAYDPVRQVSTRIKIKKHIGYNELPRGTLEIRAVPFAEVWLGKERLGTTPIAPRDVVIGSYSVTLKHENVTHMKRVEVSAGRVARVVAKMTRHR